MSARTSIHSSIEAAMGSLDLTLESELTLFRNRYAAGETVAASTPLQNEPAPSAQTPTNDPEVISNRAPVVQSEDETILEISNQEVEAAEDLAQEAARILDASLDDVSEAHRPLSTDMALDDPARRMTDLGADVDIDDIPPGAIVPSSALLPSDGALADSATLDTYTDPSLDDYLESSEALLRHLDTPVSSRQLDNSISLKWFAWAAGATLGLSLLAAFFLQNVFQTPERPDPDQEAISTETPATETPATKPPTTDTPSRVNSPDLASKEFQQVKPGSLAELPASPSSPSNEPSSDPVESSETTANPSQTTSAPSNSSDSNSASSANNLARQFFVVTDYVDAASLEQVKAIAPEAKLVNFSPAGQKIQLQTFTDESTARTAAAEFKQNGIEVEILATSSE